MFNANLTRRELLKEARFAALAAGGFFTLWNTLTWSAGAYTQESVEDVANIDWDANPAIPVPKYGCYAGWHGQISGGFRFASQETIDKKVIFYEQNSGTTPAIWSFIRLGMRTDFFPTNACDAMINRGIVPQIRHYFSPKWKEVAAGKHNKMIEEFALNAKKFGKPFILIPYPEANSGHKKHHPHAGGNGKDFYRAYKHIRQIFRNIGANNAVFGLHLNPYPSHQEINNFRLDPVDFDWIGFSAYNHERWGHDNSLMDLSRDWYPWAKNIYPKKPIALFELGSSDTSTQGKWIADAYGRIKKQLPRIKLVEWGEVGFGHLEGEKDDSTYFNDVGSIAYRQVLSDSYFIGGPLDFLNKL